MLQPRFSTPSLCAGSVSAARGGFVCAATRSRDRQDVPGHPEPSHPTTAACSRPGEAPTGGADPEGAGNSLFQLLREVLRRVKAMPVHPCVLQRHSGVWWVGEVFCFTGQTENPFRRRICVDFIAQSSSVWTDPSSGIIPVRMGRAHPKLPRVDPWWVCSSASHRGSAGPCGKGRRAQIPAGRAPRPSGGAPV